MSKMHEGDNFQRLVAIYAEGEQLIANRDYAGAIAKFGEGLSIDDNFRQRYITMYAQRAFCWLSVERWQEAIFDFTKALELEPEPNHAQYYFQRAVAHTNVEGHAEAAVADFTSSMGLYPDHPGPYHLRGKLFIDVLGRYQEGIADMTRFLSFGEHPEGYKWRAIAKLHLEDSAGALTDISRSNELQPDPYNDYMAACCCALLGYEDHMLGLIARTLSVDPAYAEFFRTHPEFERYRQTPRFLQVVNGQ